jgi:hypothetical protein
MTANREHQPALPSDRSFGITFTVVCSAFAAWLWWKNMEGATLSLSIAIALLAISFVRPSILRPLNRAWMAFGALLHRVVSPLVLGILYFGMFTPIAFALRLRGKDAMRRRADPQAESYWIRRDPPGPPSDSLKNQY